MASKLNPYLQFQDNARDAMTYYQDVFGGELNVSTFGEYNADGGDHGAAADGVMHAQLEAPNGFTLMASDTPPGMDSGGTGGNVTISLSGDDDADLRGLLGQARRRRPGDHAAREADVGRRVRHAHRPVRHLVDGEHRRGAEPGLTARSPSHHSPAEYVSAGLSCRNGNAVVHRAQRDTLACR